MKKFTALIALTILILYCAPPGFAQSSEEAEALRRENDALREALSLRKEIDALKDGQRAVQKDLEEIKTLLRARPAAAAAAKCRPHSCLRLSLGSSHRTHRA